MLRYASVLVLLTGCAVAPTQPLDDAHARGLDLGAAPPLGIDYMPLRVGVEYLPPHEHTGSPASMPSLSAARQARVSVLDEVSHQDPVRVEAIRAPRKGRGRARTNEEEERNGWFLTEKELESIHDPAERLTQWFIQDLFGEDRRRMQRELRTPILTNRIRYSSHDSLRLPIDDQEHEEEATFLNNVARGLLRRPLRKLLKRATFIRDFEVAFREFRADNIPISKDYQQDHPNKTDWGRVSLRLRLSDGSDPVELSYYNWGWRFGSSQERSRMQYRFRLSDSIDGSVRYNFNYDSHDTSIRGDLRYLVDDRTSLHLLFGDRLDFLAGPTAYSFLNSPLDGTPGVLFYVEHLF